MILPLHDFSLIDSLSSTNINSHAIESFDIKCVWFSLEIGWNQFKIFTCFFVLMSKSKSASFCLITICNLNNLISFSTENSITISTQMSEHELLIISSSPLPQNEVVFVIGVLRNVNNELICQAA